MNCFDGERSSRAPFLAGSDEVGRGPLAGAVVACSVAVEGAALAHFLATVKSCGVNDSKKLAQKKRLEILSALGIELSQMRPGESYQYSWGRFALAELSAEQIDQHNILKASMMAMEQSFHLLGLDRSAWWMVDGNKAPAAATAAFEVECVIKGDQKSLVIGLASIIAKTYRDSQMEQLALVYPGYGFEQHAGYPTAFHRQAIARLGVSAIHRRSFKGVKEYVTHAPRAEA